MSTLMFTSGWPISLILGLWGSKVSKMGYSLPMTPMNYRAKFDAASFILVGDIRNRTNTQNYKIANIK